MSYDVFLSYSRQDEKFVVTLRDLLEKNGVRCWRDKDNIGLGNWAEKIVDAIDNVPIVILVFSSNSQNSENVLKELTLSAQNKCLLIPVRIEDIAPERAFKYHLATPNVIDILDSQVDHLNSVAERIKEQVDLFSQREKKETKVTESENRSNEEALLKVLRMAYEDGQITDIERDTINNLTRDLCISIDRAKDLEARVKSEIDEANISFKGTIVQSDPVVVGDNAWPNVGIKFLKLVRETMDPARLPFIPNEIAQDDDIAEENWVYWQINEKYFISVSLTKRRLDRINVVWGIYSESEKRDPLFRQTCDEFNLIPEALDSKGGFHVKDHYYELNSEEIGNLGFETIKRVSFAELADLGFAKYVAEQLVTFINLIWSVASKKLL